MTVGKRARQLRVLVSRDLRVLVRDPVTLVLILIAPVIAALIASAGLGSPPKVSATVVVVGSNTKLGDTTALAALVPADATAATPLRFTVAANSDEARRAVRDGSAVAALIVPSSNASTATPINVIVNRNVPLVGDLATSAARTLATRLGSAATARVAPSTTAVSVDAVPSSRRPLDPGEIYGPVIAVFFLFLASGFVARGLVAERELGTLARLRTVPVSTTTIVAGKTLTMVTVAAAEFTAVLATMSLVYGARWGNLGAVAVVTLALTLAIAAIAIMIASFSQTYQSSAALVSFVALIFAVLGGSLVPLQNLPDVMRVIASFTPNGIAIAAMHDISANGRDVAGVAGATLAILAFAAVVGTVGLIRLRRTVEA